jgi:hypothetical protein
MGGHHRDLNERNYGTGLAFSCDAWSVGYDRLINSNRGEAEILSLLWGMRLAEVGPFFLDGKLGVARVGYEVPKYRVTLHQNTEVAYVSVGFVRWPRISLNIAPVPKMAGRAVIAFLKVTVPF